MAILIAHTLYFLWSFIGCVSEWVTNGMSEFSMRMRVSTEYHTAVRTAGFLPTCFLHEPKAMVLVREE